MIAGLQPMACGGCGHGLFRMFAVHNRTGDGLYAECDKCKSVSTITVSKPEVVIGWGEPADGILCPMEPKTP